MPGRQVIGRFREVSYRLSGLQALTHIGLESTNDPQPRCMHPEVTWNSKRWFVMAIFTINCPRKLQTYAVVFRTSIAANATRRNVNRPHPSQVHGNHLIRGVRLQHSGTSCPFTAEATPASDSISWCALQIGTQPPDLKLVITEGLEGSAEPLSSLRKSQRTFHKGISAV
jgi:hypothetical protein